MANSKDSSQSNHDPGPKAATRSTLSQPHGQVYQITVRGQLANDWSDWFDGLQMTTSAGGDTVLSGTIVDQAALMGVLNKLNRLNMALLSLSQVDNTNRCESTEKGGKPKCLNVHSPSINAPPAPSGAKQYESRSRSLPGSIAGTAAGVPAGRPTRPTYTLMPPNAWYRLDRDKGSNRQSARQALCLSGFIDGPATSSRAIKFGLIGSLAGTIAMDLVLVVESLIVGEPVDGFVALIGSALGGGTLVGVVAHLLMGSLLGLLFGIASCKVRLLNIGSVRKGVWLGVLAGLVTIPLGCVPFAIVADFPIIELVSFSFIPHLVWGAVLGVIAGYAMHSGPHPAEASASR